MSLVIADTGPVHYLVLIEEISVLPALFEHVFIPATVRDEMLDPKTPDSVRRWIEAPPAWLQLSPDPAPQPDDPGLAELDAGERAAVQLAVTLQANLVLMDDRAGVVAAKQKGLLVTGTLGVLDLAADRGLVQIEVAVQRLTATNFRYPQVLIDRLLDSRRRKGPLPREGL
jgi:predicted nucleic acid-binding protein